MTRLEQAIKWMKQPWRDRQHIPMRHFNLMLKAGLLFYDPEEETYELKTERKKQLQRDRRMRQGGEGSR